VVAAAVLLLFSKLELKVGWLSKKKTTEPGGLVLMREAQLILDTDAHTHTHRAR